MVTADYRKLARLAAHAAADKKAVDIQVLDIRSESDVADYLVIAGAESSAQMKAVEASVAETLEKSGVRPLHQDGRPTDRWMALDYGGLVVHILLPEAREFYRLEQMWESARSVTWNGKSKAKK